MGDNIYTEEMVPDGLYFSMAQVKSFELEDTRRNQVLFDTFTDYKHIILFGAPYTVLVPSISEFLATNLFFLGWNWKFDVFKMVELSLESSHPVINAS